MVYKIENGETVEYIAKDDGSLEKSPKQIQKEKESNKKTDTKSNNNNKKNNSSSEELIG